ncbi:hypothetical protein LCGC14_0103040 [marine sediment metagenome]|uniref:DUF916 domain-containing protein n=1 Tax=marine sediment metagenome TaxID=412755 RepID=A0A0F9YEI4_9ZZZZ|nr:hypothetical protein [Candidatus Nealsonbacteria bacterium]
MKFWVLIGFFLAIGVMLLPQGAQALTVSPVRVELAADPGANVKGVILLINEQEGTRTFYSSLENFEALGETGTPTFIESAEGLATWIETASQVTIEQGEKKEVPYTIIVPQDADPGGHFAAIFWSTSPPRAEEEGGVSIGVKLGVLILLRVSGEIEEEGGLLEFNAQDKQSFFSSLPITLTYRFQNGGGDRVKPEGEITIKNIFGRISAVLPANESEGNVLPQSIRKFQVTWDITQKEGELNTRQAQKDDEKVGFFGAVKRQWSDFHFGRYTTQLNLNYGAENEKAEAGFSFFVIPWQLLSIILFVVMVVGLLSKIAIKRYNQWIIARAVQMQVPKEINTTKARKKIKTNLRKNKRSQVKRSIKR